MGGVDIDLPFDSFVDITDGFYPSFSKVINVEKIIKNQN